MKTGVVKTKSIEDDIVFGIRLISPVMVSIMLPDSTISDDITVQ
jgi:hypothetical protein